MSTGVRTLAAMLEQAAVAQDATEPRVGRLDEGEQTRAFVAGVYKKAVGASACAVKVNSEGQLGCNSDENSTAVATFASRKEVASGRCLAYTDIAPAGNGACPPKTSGFSSSTTLAPTPANGATVTNLYADTSATVGGTDSVLVAVIDNTTGRRFCHARSRAAPHTVAQTPADRVLRQQATTSRPRSRPPAKAATKSCGG